MHIHPFFFLSTLVFLLLLCLQLNPQNPTAAHSRRLLRGHHRNPLSPPLPPPLSSASSLAPSLPPTQPPSPSFPKYPSSSLPTPTTPTTITTPASTLPFFPVYPSPPPPPSPILSSLPTFPANISSLGLPTPRRPSPPNLLPTVLLPLLSVCLLALTLSLLLLHLRRRRRSTAGKDARSDSLRLFPPPPPSTSNPSREFLYLGTLVSSHTNQPSDPNTSTGAGTGGDCSSPELRPLPPLPRHLGCQPEPVEKCGSRSSTPSSVSDPGSFVSSSLPTSSSSQHVDSSSTVPSINKSKSSETVTGDGERGDIGLRPPPLPPPPATLLRRPNPCPSSNERPRLKPLYWDKLPPSSNREMAWDQLKTSSFQLNEEMIRSLFACKTTNNVINNGVNLVGQENGLLDPKKSQNIAIMLRALNVSKEQVCEFLLDGCLDKIGTEVLEALMKMVPTKEEERKLKEHRDDSPFKLGPAESFLKEITEIPFAFKRADALLYIANFGSEVNHIWDLFRILEAACEELKSSRLFQKLLGAVLKTGNRINLGTNRGDAKAFKLDTLLKLADIKSTDGNTTLLHFVLQEMIKSDQLGLRIIYNLGLELTNVKKAAEINPDELSGIVSKLSVGIEKVREILKLNASFSSRGSGMRFHDLMSGFLARAEEEILKIQNQESFTLSLVREIGEFFHGDSAEEESQPFKIFMIVRDFLAMLDRNRVCKENGGINGSFGANFGCPVSVPPVSSIPSLI